MAAAFPRRTPSAAPPVSAARRVARLHAAPPRLPPRYRAVERIGVGGIGEVWRAEDVNLDRELAVKLLRPDRRTPEQAARLTREALLTGRLQHPGVPPVVERGRCGGGADGADADGGGGESGGPFFAMKLVRGRTLRELLKEPPTPGDGGPLASGDLPRLLGIFGQVCDAVGYAHSRGVIHRDLKPSNVMVGDHGEVQVMDWGMARLIRGGAGEGADGVDDEDETVLAPLPAAPTAAGGGTAFEEEAGAELDPFFTRVAAAGEVTATPGSAATAADVFSTLTRAGTGVGTPAYMPPEQARGERLHDPRSDVFGLGAILCVVLTGRPPFAAPDGLSSLGLAAAGDLSAAYARLDDCDADDELTALCRRCLAPAPADRPPNGAAVADAVRAYEDGVRRRLEEERTTRAAAEVRVAEERKRRRVWAGLATVTVACVLIAAAAGWAWQQRRLTDRLRAESAREEITGLLDQTAALRDDYRFDAAATLLANADRRLPAAASRALAAAVTGAERDLAVVRELDRIRLRKATWSNAGFDTAFASGPDGAYAAAFRAYGLEIPPSDPAILGTAIAAGPVGPALTAGLDDWATGESDRGLKAKLLAAAQAADPHPVREALLAGDPEALRRAAEATDPATLRPTAAVLLAEALRNVGDSAAGAEALAAATVRYPDDFWLHFTAQNLFSAAPVHRPQVAIGHARAALAVRPGNTAALNGLGLLLESLGQPALAEAAFRQALTVDPDFAYGRNNLGLLLEDLGRTAEAEESLRAAIAADPDFAMARNNLGVLLRRSGRLAEAEAAYRAAALADPGYAAAPFNLGLLLKRAGRLKEAEEAFQTALRANPGHIGANNSLGNVLADLGRIDEAEAAYRAALAAAPKDADVLANLGLLLRDATDRFDEAATVLRQAHELGTAQPGWHYPSDQWVAQAEVLAANAGQLNAIFAGTADPPGGAEALALGEYALVNKSRPLDAARLYAAGLSDPATPDGAKSAAWYNAACAALQASAGSRDASPLPAGERSRWRDLARGWLAEELADWRSRIDLRRNANGRLPTDFANAVREELTWWNEDSDLAPVRGADLAGLPPDERTQWQRLWTVHAAVVRTATGPVTAPKPATPRQSAAVAGSGAD